MVVWFVQDCGHAATAERRLPTNDAMPQHLEVSATSDVQVTGHVSMTRPEYPCSIQVCLCAIVICCGLPVRKET